MRVLFFAPSLLFTCFLFTFSGSATESPDVPVAQPFKFTRVFADSTGASHFSAVEMNFKLADFAPPAPPISVSEIITADKAFMISSPAGWYGDWHPAPARQYVIVLTGELEVQVSDGETRRFGPGAVIFVEDTFGKGHISKAVGSERVYCLVVAVTSDK